MPLKCRESGDDGFMVLRLRWYKERAETECVWRGGWMDNKSRKRVVKPHYGSVEWEEEEEEKRGETKEKEKKDMARIKSLLSDEEILQCAMVVTGWLAGLGWGEDRTG
ncbi:hypothetical protein TWF506_005069 [Arthrobotrys conoides]|uniref:Uncharacterized protein n=1 Tax=Arthrobotrys conoides TaxID=74498 RepID=A0AAN8P5P8_9PEZI